MMTNWEEKFIRFASERWVFQGSDPHDFTPRVMLLALGEDFLSPLLGSHKHFGALYTGYIGGRLVGYMRVPPGTVILEGIMRSLKFTRVDTVIGLGTCGALQEDIDCGDIIVAESSRAGDCLSLHYGYEYGDLVPADPELTAALAGFLDGRGLPVRQGPIVTTGAVFRETEELISSWNRDGLLAVELEASSQFALANYMGLKTAMALLVTDSPVRNETSDVIRGRERDKFVNGLCAFIGSPFMA
ncbi:MAG TPA: hypothetical protein ENH44_00875 [Actinobacteria bacterium]|nr:hypothetical protein [Actinomycetota bacterium]